MYYIKSKKFRMAGMYKDTRKTYPGPYYVSNCKITEKDKCRKLAGETANVQTIVFSSSSKSPIESLDNCGIVELCWSGSRTNGKGQLKLSL